MQNIVLLLKFIKSTIKKLSTQRKKCQQKKNILRSIGDEICVLMLKNEHTEDQVFGLTEEQEKVTGATEKLRELGNLKGKISNKVATITKEHKFFTKNTVCPTCTQAIEEEYMEKIF